MKLSANLLPLLAAGEFTDFSEAIDHLYKQLAVPLLAIVGGAAVLLGLWLGSKFLFAGGDEQKIKKAKESIKYFVIGIAVIFIVAAGTPMLIAAFQGWQEKPTGQLVSAVGQFLSAALRGV
jgi:cytochrome bd-type quinol oxidase subunit 2